MSKAIDKLKVMRTVFDRMTGGSWYLDKSTGVNEIWSMDSDRDDELLIGNAAGGYMDPSEEDAEMIVFAHRWGPKMEAALTEINAWVESGAGEGSMNYKLAKAAVSDIIERHLGGGV